LTIEPIVETKVSTDVKNLNLFPKNIEIALLQLAEDIDRCERYLQERKSEKSAPVPSPSRDLPSLHPTTFAGKPMTHFETIIDILKYRGCHQSDRMAYTFLQDGEIESDHLTYGELQQKAEAIAARLQELHLTGERALLLYAPGLDFIPAFFGCLAAGVVAVPAYPPRPNQTSRRLRAIIEDARAKVVLTTEDLLETVEKATRTESSPAELHYIASDRVEPNLVEPRCAPKLSANDLAFLQYTSGSTGNPKGVMVSHGNILHNESLIARGFGHNENSSGLGWLPLFHDMGLIGNVLQPLYMGMHCYLMAPIAFLQKPIRWLAALSRYRATTSGGPNFAYDLCVRKITDEQKATLDLSHWQTAFNGAEPIHADTLDRFTERFADVGFRREAFYPCYGMAETTLMVSGRLDEVYPLCQSVRSDALAENRIVLAHPEENGVQRFVSCGRPLGDLQVAIVHPDHLVRLPDNEVGEIWVAGASVTLGYWERPEATQETFQAYIQNTGEGPFLRTGDLGFRQGNELFITGRLKDLIVIRGRNYYPQDIEGTVARAHSALNPDAGAAFSVEMGDRETLVIVQEVERTKRRSLETEEVFAAIRESIFQEYELTVGAIVLLSPGSIPKTSSGKIQRHACRNDFLANGFKEIARWQSPAIETLPAPGIKGRDEIVPAVGLSSSGKSQGRADEMIGWFREYAEKRINSRLIDERRCIPPHIVLDLGNHGFLGLQIPENYGGMGLTTSDSIRVIQQVAAVDLTLASFMGVNHALGTRPIANFARPELRERFLPAIARGRELAAYALTEPGAGSHPRAITTTAIADSRGGWRLRGEKMFIGSGSWAGVTNVFARLLDESGKPVGITGFAIEQGTPGLEQGPEALTMGMRGMVQNRIYLNDVFVPTENLLGEAGAGMEVAKDAMMFGRLGLGAIAVGGMKRCAQLMLRYASRRSISTGLLLDHPVTLDRLSGLTASIAAVETLVERVARRLDHGGSVPEEIYIACKISGPEFLWQAADHLTQLLGGRGYLETNLAPQILRDARLMRIFEGPTETLQMFLGSRVLNDSEALDRFFLEEFTAPEIIRNLHLVAGEIREFYDRPISDRAASAQWVYCLVGELATLAILRAALASSSIAPSERGQRAIAYLQQRFEQLRQQALSGDRTLRNLRDSRGISAEIASFSEMIGDLEQTLPGEEQELDPLLRRDRETEPVRPVNPEAIWPSQHSAPALEPKIIAPAPTTNATAIQQWLIRWLSENLKISATSIAVHRSFAEYGMDSVMAVEIAQDLETWLNRPIEPTILWNYPNIEALADYLALPSVVPAPRSTPTVEESQEENLSESDIARLLAEEILKNRQAIGVNP
jgi:acyl-CoA synthetase (AMP-forming)/AMP-acid ligase II/alkylation response protein AidB-like acyl-CoA dehydrogenase/acyl carrier protein